MSNVIKWAKPYFMHPAWHTPSGPPAPLYTHHEWAVQQAPASQTILALIQTQLNPIVRHCRIGKITLKTKA